MNDDYKVIFLKKKNKVRKIVTYRNQSQRDFHQFINDKISSCFTPSIFSKGYVKNQSIYSNVSSHMYNNYFYKTDIKNFFQSINHRRLADELYKELYAIATPTDCYNIVKQCSYGDVGIPLGFITSPLLANIYLKRFDIVLYNKLKKLKCDNIIYTRYADDLMISFMSTSEDINSVKERIKKLIDDELHKYYLKVNEKKTQFISFNRAKQVRLTGITIVEKNGVRRLSIGRNQKRKFFYYVINSLKNECISNDSVKRIKGLLSYYLSVEKTDFEDFISDNMKKELNNFGYDSIVDLINNL